MTIREVIYQLEVILDNERAELTVTTDDCHGAFHPLTQIGVNADPEICTKTVAIK